MAKLEDRYTTGENSVFPETIIEKWTLNNLIKASVFYGKTCTVFFSHVDNSGITEQVYEKLVNHEVYSDIKLELGWGYYIDIEESKVQELLKAAEQIDINTLKAGRKCWGD